MTSNTEPSSTLTSTRAKNTARPVLIGVSVIAVLALAASVWFGIGWMKALSEKDTAEVRDSALFGAQQAAINLSSVDSADLDGSLDNMLSSITGDEMTNYLEETKASITDEQRNSGRKITAEVLGSTLTELSTDDKTATAVVIVANTTTGPGGTPAERTRAVSRMYLRDVDGVWKVEKVLPVGERTAIDSDNSPVYPTETDPSNADPAAPGDPAAPAAPGDPAAPADPAVPAAPADPAVPAPAEPAGP